MSELLGRATTARARLTVEGHPRPLPAGLELSGYRIVEHVLTALPDAPDASVAVIVRFEPDALELRVSGPAGTEPDPLVPLAAARERASLHGGTVDSRVTAGRRDTTARLPLVTSYA